MQSGCTEAKKKIPYLYPINFPIFFTDLSLCLKETRNFSSACLTVNI